VSSESTEESFLFSYSPCDSGSSPKKYHHLANIGEWLRIEDNTVVGEDVTVKSELYINDTVVLLRKCVSQDLPTTQVIL
jgi:UDP-3-O-[3-hydroxymyristoyl] glucosamine N-acyltransferase